MAWILLAAHQIVFEEVAVAFRKECGCAGLAPQTIGQVVNVDLKKIFSLARSEEIDIRKAEYFKVTDPIYYPR